MLVEASQAYLPSLTLGRYSQRLLGKATGLNPRKDEFGDEMGYGEIFAQGIGVREFNSRKEAEKKLKELQKELGKKLKGATEAPEYAEKIWKVRDALDSL
jgi:hypothetical protein